MDFGHISESDVFSNLRQRAPEKRSKIPRYASDGMLRTKPRISLDSPPQKLAVTPVHIVSYRNPLADTINLKAIIEVPKNSQAEITEIQEPLNKTSKQHNVKYQLKKFSLRRRYSYNRRPLFYRLRSITKSQVVMYILAAALFTGGLGISLDGWRTNAAVHAQVSQLAENASSQSEAAPKPDSPGVTASASSGSRGTVKPYVVAPDMPKYIKILSIKVNARVVSVGTLKDGSIGTPTPNTNQVGWFNASSKPGKAGAMIIDGHVSGLDTVGVFYKLKNLNTGDTVQIIRGDDETISYRVVKTTTYDADKVDMAALGNPIDFSKPGLNLITCAGKYDTKSAEFNQRTVVFTVQI